MDLSHTRCAQAVEGLQERVKRLRRVEHVGAENEVEGPLRSDAAEVLLVAPAEPAHLQRMRFALLSTRIAISSENNASSAYLTCMR